MCARPCVVGGEGDEADGACAPRARARLSKGRAKSLALRRQSRSHRQRRIVAVKVDFEGKVARAVKDAKSLSKSPSKIPSKTQSQRMAETIESIGRARAIACAVIRRQGVSRSTVDSGTARCGRASHWVAQGPTSAARRARARRAAQERRTRTRQARGADLSACTAMLEPIASPQPVGERARARQCRSTHHCRAGTFPDAGQV